MPQTLQYPRTQLARESKKICDSWEVPEIPIDINPRFQTTLGQFSHSIIGGTPIKIQFSGSLIKNCSAESVFKVLYHELAHYIQLLIFGYTDHDRLFFETLDAINPN